MAQCPPNLLICGNSCIANSTDPLNCGSCEKRCDITDTTVAFCSPQGCKSAPSCTSPLINCNGRCILNSTDILNCGQCGNSCVAPANGGVAFCSKGICTANCPSQLTPCGGGITGPTTCLNGPCSSTSASISSSTTVFSSTSTGGTPTSTTSSSPTSTGYHTSSPGSTLSAGTTAGIGIGCAVVGALLAGLFVFFILSRRNHRNPNYQQSGVPSNGREYAQQEKSGVTTTMSNVDRLLPQPTEDDAIIAGLSKIRDAIKNHVQNYYHAAPVDPKVVDEAGLVELASALGISTSGIVDLLLNPATRMAVLRIYLGYLILSRCDGQPNTKLSFLPSEVSVLAVSDGGARANTAGKSDFEADVH
jgi:hypothetical protein